MNDSLYKFRSNIFGNNLIESSIGCLLIISCLVIIGSTCNYKENEIVSENKVLTEKIFNLTNENKILTEKNLNLVKYNLKLKNIMNKYNLLIPDDILPQTNTIYDKVFGHK